MIFRKPIWVAFALGMIAMGALVGCAASDAPAAAGPLQVTVSIVPQQYFVERIGRDLVDTNVIVVPGANEATYEPKPEQLRALSASAAYLSIGVPFENAWLDRIRSANPDMRIVDTTAGIDLIPLAEHHHDGEEVDHGDENLDPHIWLSPELVKVQARTIYEALGELDPAHEPEFKQGLDIFLADIDNLDDEIRQTLSGIDNRVFMVFHPSWGYFARDYQLDMIAIEVGGQEPSAQELAQIITEAKDEGIRVILAQPEFSTRAAQTIAQEIGGEVVLVSPLAYDWIANLREVADVLARSLSN